MTTIALLVAASLAIAIGMGDPRKLLRDVDLFTVAWVVALAAWPYIVIYCVAPLIWASADAAGPLNPALQYFPAATFSAVALILGLRSDRVDVSLPAALIGTTLLFAGVSVWVSGFEMLINYLLGAALFVGVLLKRRITTIKSVGVGAVLGLQFIAIAALVGALLGGDAIVGECREDKCQLVATALTSPFAGNGNALGMATALLVPFAFTALPFWRALIVVCGVGPIQILAGSRTAMFALAIGVTALILIELAPELKWKLRLGFLAVLTGLAASVHILFRKYSGSTDSYRGYLWEMAADALGRGPVFGQGPSYWWTLNREALFAPNYSPHNGWLDILVAVGICGLVILVVGVVVHLSTMKVELLPYLLAYFATVLTVNMLESVYVPYFYGILPFVAIVPLMIYEPKEPTDNELADNLSAVRHPESRGKVSTRS